MQTNAPTGYPENAVEAASLDVIARFAMAQEEIGLALHKYLGGALSEPVGKLVRRRLRLSDEERLDALVALAETVAYPLHVTAYRNTYADTKAVRDRLAHGGPPLVGRFEGTKEPMLWAFESVKGKPGASRPHTHSLTDLRAYGANARWLARVAWRVRAVITEEEVPENVRVPSDLPQAAVINQPANRDGWGEPPLCPRGHANVYGVSTFYGDAWLCGHCDHVQVRDEASLIGVRSTLAATT
ncbi:hypothetical protein IFU40_05575 [Microbacterium sp. CFBP 13617]|uniref:hypothetical protein n=1 Tax=Microbacterium sp. CFBP 13617 TaxID=2774035 RepID=UPI00177BE027|nr:hypothetical protein [Microbacterium sp. CFBP 13617]MBD8218106.1 hypothetical protein [Microbacterium sp. CFBP 13617]